MDTFQLLSSALIAAWLASVAIWFRRDTVVLVGGLTSIGLLVAAAVIRRQVALAEVGVSLHRLVPTLGYAFGGLAVMLAYSPAADWIASRLIVTPPRLGAFRALQQSLAKLAAGILVAWALGGVLEELVFRGVLLNAVEALAAQRLPRPAAIALAVAAAAGGAGIIHLYQGPRAALIITQLSVLFGLVFVLSGHNLWAVMLCHGLYDTVAFIRFGLGRSKYSKAEREPD